jgi:lipopolysaccharide/colanic/teichoic acid biosynthesis glycosyltransferase
VFLFSLWLTLWIRYQTFPSTSLFYDHLQPFSLLFLASLIVFFIAGLYEKHTLILKSQLPSVLLNTQILNSILAIIFFYFIPYFGIAPKTNLFIYIIVSSCFFFLWRLYGPTIPWLFGSRNKQGAILVGSGEEVNDLYAEVNGNTQYPLKFISRLDISRLDQEELKNQIAKQITSQGSAFVVIDFRDERVAAILPELYNLIFSHVHFIDFHRMYEDIFDRIPLSLVRHDWFLENISTSPKTSYDFLKRITDVLAAIFFGMISLIFYPFIILAIKIDDGGSIFISQDRVGQNNKIFTLLKFRSMSFNDSGNPSKVAKNKVTRVGNFIRKTRIDELPQLWNLLKGDVSLIGPRPEFPAFVAQYEKEIPYYRVRHLIKPGLSGWAQLYHKDPPKMTVDKDKTRAKLSYDLYYIKNRSLLLDIKIALKTLKVFTQRSGR